MQMQESIDKYKQENMQNQQEHTKPSDELLEKQEKSTGSVV